MLTVAGDPLKELVVGVITDTGKGGSTVGSITQSCRCVETLPSGDGRPQRQIPIRLEMHGSVG